MTWLVIACALMALSVLVLWRMLALQSAANKADLDLLHEEGTQHAVHAANYRLKLNALTQSSGAAIVMLDERGTVVHANSIAEAILGVEPESLAGHPFSETSISNELRDFFAKAGELRKPRTTDVRMPESPHAS